MEMKSFIFVIPAETKKKVKVQSAKMEISMKEFVIDAINEKLERRK